MRFGKSMARDVQRLRAVEVLVEMNVAFRLYNCDA